MENVISARRLRKSVLNSVGDVDLNIDSYKVNKERIYKERGYSKPNSKNENNIVINFKTRFIIKLFFCSVILFSVLVTKIFLLDNIKKNDTVVKLYNHYNMDFSRANILEKVEYRFYNIDLSIGNIFPDKLKEYLKGKYFTFLKPYILEFDLKSALKDLVNLDSNKKEVIIENKNIEAISSNSNYIAAKEKEEVLNGIGGAEPLNEKKEEATSSISIMENDVNVIKSKKINIISPVVGVITSRYGIREVVFTGVDPYHTGIDIANKKGTKILSATKGIVTKIEYNNKYYGNFLEITENGVVFKYAHLDSISVKLNNIIKQNENIGFMGNTGMSTGPHLHFEIRIDGRTVNPEELLKF